jgi:hypothetical protein
MLKSKTISILTAAMIVASVMAGVATEAQAKRAKCAAVPVPGQPGVKIVTCTTARP